MRAFGLLALLALASCDVDPYCLDCFDGATGSRDGGLRDGGVRDGGDGSTLPPADACVFAGAEICDGFDNDCNGMIDDGLTDVGVACGTDVGPCTPGTTECIDGDLVCGGGAVNPVAETCNGADDDCDGTADDGDPGGGVLCGTDVGDCLRGTTMCQDGMVACVGEIGPAPEACDGRDNDCDGTVDDGNPEGGGSCGEDMGACVAGTVTCSGGVLQCIGAVPPTIESCDMVDNDCDGMIDEDFDFASDPDHCGDCTTQCTAMNAGVVCTMSSCEIGFCFTGWWDLDGDYTNGCEYMCDFAGAEICNGEDDDCDGATDEGLSPPPICNTFGECAGTTATCGGAAGWECDYPPTVSTDASGAITPESDCDDLDNDCDAVVDEAFPEVGSPCTDGVGACMTFGSYACNAAGDGTFCTAPTPPDLSTATELCNGVDDNCNGSVDDGASDTWVPIMGTGVTGTKWIYKYEASRPNATSTSAGSSSARSCSNPNRIPWTNVTHPEAETACAAAGGRLCSEAEWQRACETNVTAANVCFWSFDTTCRTYNATKCNGNDYDFNPATPAVNEDGLLPTQSLSGCYANWGSMTNRVYDLSGNVKEWTLQRSAGVNPLRGGSYNNTATGINCQFNFVVADDTFQFANVGFRCCRDTAP